MNYDRDEITNSVIGWLKDNNNVIFLFFMYNKKKPHKYYSQIENSYISFLVILLPKSLIKTT